MNSRKTNDREVTRLMDLRNEQTASLMLMVLCDDILDLRELEVKSDDEVFESRLRAVICMTNTPSRKHIATALRNLRGTYLTEGEVVSFTHPHLYDTCLRAAYQISPKLILKHCSIEFLCDRVRPIADSPVLTTDIRNIDISKSDLDIIVSRLAAAIDWGNYSLAFTHPIMEVKKVHQHVFLELERRKSFLTERVLFPYNTDRGRYLLQWVALSLNEFLLFEVFARGYRPSKREFTKTFLTCASCGNGKAMGFLFAQALVSAMYVVSPALLKNAFSLAVDKGQIETVSLLIKNGAEPTDLSFNRKKKLFSIYAKREYTEVCKSFLTQFLHNSPLLYVVITVFETYRGMPFRSVCTELLHIAYEAQHLVLADLVAGFSDMNLQGHNGWTLVMRAAYTGKEDMFDLLVAKGADLSVTDCYGDNVLHLACRGGHTSIVSKLLTLFDINSRGTHGWTPIMNAAYSGKKEVFDFLIEHGADVSLPNDDGDTIIHYACRGGDISIVRYLLPLFDINTRGHVGVTPLMNSVWSGNTALFDLLLAHNADVTLVDDMNDSLLHLASGAGNLVMVKHVLPYCNVNSKDKQGWTPPMVALVFGHSRIFQYLAGEGADLTTFDTVRDDLVTLAYQGGCRDIAQQLTPAGDLRQTLVKWTEVMKLLVCGSKEALWNLTKDSPELSQRDCFGDTATPGLSRW